MYKHQFSPALDYVYIIYVHASVGIPKPLDAVYDNEHMFIIGDSFRTPHCTLYVKIDLTSNNVNADVEYKMN